MKLCIYQDLSCMNMQNIYLYVFVQSFIYDVVLSVLYSVISIDTSCTQDTIILHTFAHIYIYTYGYISHILRS